MTEPLNPNLAQRISCSLFRIRLFSIKAPAVAAVGAGERARVEPRRERAVVRRPVRQALRRGPHLQLRAPRPRDPPGPPAPDAVAARHAAFTQSPSAKPVVISIDLGSGEVQALRCFNTEFDAEFF